MSKGETSLKKLIKELKNPTGKIDVEAIYKQVAPFQYVSFDIFDTLIKRNVKTPKDIFSIIEMRYGDGFASKRISAEKQSRENCPNEEVTLKDIYNYYPTEDKDGLMKLELNTELASIVANIPMIEVYNRSIEDGKTVFITTDMYWPEEAILKLLETVGVRNYKALYLSSKEQKTKKTGTLFTKLLFEQGIQASKLVHIGDHKKSDYEIPCSLGISAVKIPTKVEGVKFKHKSEGIQNNYLNSFIKNTYPGNTDPYYAFGYTQFGKLLWGYSHWIHQMAVKEDIHELYFFARDGWIMKRAYDTCISDSDVKTHYLEVSRRSLRVPILWRNFDYDKVLSMVVNAKLVSIASVFDGVGLDIKDYSDKLQEFHIDKDTVYDRTTIMEDKNLKALLMVLKDTIISNSKLEYEALSSYLELEGVNGKIAVIDIGYAGSMQRYLQQALSTLHIEHEITGFYLAVAEYYKKNDSPENPIDLYGYLFDFKHEKNAIDTRSSFVGLFESFFLEQGGSVKRYVKSADGLIVERYPYEYYRDGKPTEDYKKIKSLQQGALDFINIAAKNRILEMFDFSVDDLFYGIHQTGINPDRSDLDLFANIEFYDEGVTEKLASPQSIFCYLGHIKDLKRDFLACRWKIGFMKKLFKMNLPYQKMYLKLKRVDNK